MLSDWPVVTLSAVAADELRNGVFKKKTEFGKGTLLVNVADVFKGLNVNAATLDRVSVTPEEQSRFSALPGDVLFVRSSLKKEGLAHSCVVGRTDEPLVFECHLIRVRPNLSMVEPLFLAYFTHSPEFRREVMSHAKTVAITTIGQDALGSVPIRLPPLPEQNKIAAILSSVDGSIAAIQAVIEQLQVVKKVMMAELFTKGIPGRHEKFKTTEIGEVPDEWAVIPIGEVAEIHHGFAYEGRYFRDTETRDILLTPGNFQIGGGFKGDKLKYYDGPTDEGYVLPPGELVVTMTDLSKSGDTLGYSAIVPRINGHRFLHNQRIGRLEIKDRSVTTEYLALAMRTGQYRRRILETASGTTVRHTSPSRIQNVLVPVPPTSEQEGIARVISLCEENERANIDSLLAFRHLKAALMSVLLTGEVRVRPDEAAA